MTTYPFLPTQWQTERLTICDCTLEDVSELQSVFNANAALHPFDPTFGIYPAEEFLGLIQKSLMIGQTPKDRFKLQPIRFHQTSPIVGYFHGTHANPKEHVFFVSMFVVHPAYQQYKIGTEVVNGLAEQLRRLGYGAIWLAVYLKNWVALRFWIQQQFVTIIDYDGERVHTPTGHADIVLARTL